ncbi:aminopeptidase N [Roseibium sp. CAU 1637]|uniref:Aminopeptidase N n=1 Tax=Roseibium limicola TaxID=2816037 RepID=A0A939ENP9_9HYPH|nr:aminopeptidase N [Roseibium limicola]MBO0345166.1 aminopeptidase N [Roseibium limicola]
MRSDTAPAIRLEDYSPAPYTIEAVALDMQLAPKATQVHARLTIRRLTDTLPGTPLVLDGGGLELTSLSVNGVAIPVESYTVTPDKLELLSPPSEPFELEIGTRIDPDANTQLEGLYRSSGTYCTQCEAEGFRRITYFLDRPDVLAVYTTRIEARKSEAPILLGNGNPVESGPVPDKPERHFAIWHDPHPKPSYLFAMVAGDLAHVADSFTTRSGRNVDLKIYVEHGREDKCDWAMDSLKRSMRWDEEVFGCEYDLDVFNIVAVSDFNMGAMENKGLNIFNDKYVLADQDTATDQDYANIEAVIAHEYFHNWTGNRITCRDWFQLCLKEGLTVFRDQEFSSDMRSRAVKRISDVRLLKSHQFPEDAGPLAHPVRPRKYTEINNFYTATVYEKGAEVVRMLKTLVGADGFKAGTDLYFQRHDGEATTIEAFLACFAEVSGQDLSHFALWYEQAGTPLVEVESSYDATAQSLTLQISQEIAPLPGQADSKPAVIPIRFGLIGSDGADMSFDKVEGAEVRQDCLILSQRRQTVRFSGVSERPALSLLRGFSAPVKLHAPEKDQDLAFRAAHDSDPFNRWQASQTLATQSLLRLVRAAEAGEELVADSVVLDVFGSILSDGSLDPAFRALSLQLPGEADLAREIGKNVDPTAVLKARDALRAALGSTHMDLLRAALSQRESGPFDPGAEAAGKRALANQALAYFAASDASDAALIVNDLFDRADNMTDRLAALTLLVHGDLPGAQAALEAFRNRHETSSLALDKWFMVQATAPLSSTLETVRDLAGHRLFDENNPNRVRSLVHAFATGNPSQFGRPDGAGFSFVADHVLALDARNPQVAARLLTCFRSWRAYEAQRSSHAEAALQRISEAENLSRDSRDIVDRCLQ